MPEQAAQWAHGDCGRADHPFIALVGPTAVGKTNCALSLASRLPLEIINADSRQVYRHMNIGTGKPTPAEQALVPHHLYDVVDPNEEFSLACYQRLAIDAMSVSAANGNVPLLVGGSGQYVWSLVEGWCVPEVPPDKEFRRALEQQSQQYGYAALHDRLKGIDPQAAAQIQATNVRRVIRALELHHATGERPSSLLRLRRPPQRVLIIGLTMERRSLLGIAYTRVDTMMRRGLAAEVENLLFRGFSPDLPAMSSIGYRELVEYLTGAIDLHGATERIKMQTGRLIRRQYTWFRPSDIRIVWLDAADPVAAAAVASETIEAFLG